MKCGVFPEHPIPENIAARSGDICNSESAICIALRSQNLHSLHTSRYEHLFCNLLT